MFQQLVIWLKMKTGPLAEFGIIVVAVDKDVVNGTIQTLINLPAVW